MDIEAADRDLVTILLTLPGPIRIPTARWLFSDLFGLLDNEVNLVLAKLIARGKVKQTSGGWLEVRR